MEEYAFRWIHGVVLVVLFLFVNLVFTFFGLTLSLATLGSAVESLSALTFVLLAFILLPVIYGAISAQLSDWFGQAQFPSDIDVKELVLMWIHGLVLTVLLLVVTTAFAVFGVAFSFAILATAVEGLTALIFIVVAFFALPFVFGYISHGLTELLH